MDSSEPLTVNGRTVDFHEIDDSGDIPRIRFKLDNVWRSLFDYIIPGMTVMAYVLRLHQSDPTGFWSRENPGDREGHKGEPASNSEVKRWLENGAVRFNGRTMKGKELLDFPLYSVVFFPKGNRVTIL